MKKRKQDPVELTLEEKLKNVRQAGVIMLQGRRESANDFRLGDYGVDPELLTDELLLAAYLGPWPGLTTLQLLSICGCLGQIPEKCLRHQLVHKRIRYYWCGSWKSHNFLEFCAHHGCYRDLPKKYQTRATILPRSRQWISSMPLLAAAKVGNLNTLPLKTLECGDIDEETLVWAGAKDQLELLAHLLTAEQLLRAPFDRHFSCSVLCYLVWHGHLEKVPPDRLVNDYPLVIGEVKKGLKELDPIKSLAPLAAQELSAKALTWLAKVSQLRLNTWKRVN